MNQSKITVYQNGKPATRAKVSLEFTGLTTMGFTKSYYTNSEGVAVVEHSSSGTAKVYINGMRREKMNAPGECIVHI